MSVTRIPIKKKLGLELHRKYTDAQARLHPLSYLFWECTLRCNLGCKHCGSDCRKNMSQKDMPAVDFLRAVDQIAPHVDRHSTLIVITGGEPLMRNDLENIGRELYDREFPWGMVTNGLALTEKRLHALIEAGLRSVTVSFDGFEDQHNTLRGNPQSFQKAKEAIRYLVEAGDDIVFDVVTCVNPDNFASLEAFGQFLIDMGVKRWRIFTVFPIGRAAANQDLQLPPLQFRKLFEFIRTTRKKGDIQVSYGCEGFLGNYETEVRDHFFFCRAGIQIGSILVDGSIAACPNLRSNFIQGSIYQDDFMDVWNNRYQSMRDRKWMKTGKCAACTHFRYCKGNGMHLRDEEGNLLFCHLERLKEGE